MASAAFPISNYPPVYLTESDIVSFTVSPHPWRYSQKVAKYSQSVEKMRELLAKNQFEPLKQRTYPSVWEVHIARAFAFRDGHEIVLHHQVGYIPGPLSTAEFQKAITYEPGFSKETFERLSNQIAQLSLDTRTWIEPPNVIWIRL